MNEYCWKKKTEIESFQEYSVTVAWDLQHSITAQVQGHQEDLQVLLQIPPLVSKPQLSL